MRLTVRSIVYSADFEDSLRQMQEQFAARLVARAGQEQDFANIGELFLSVTPQHPMFGPPKMRRSYAKSHDLYSVESPADYGVWATADWPGRTDEYARALSVAVGRIAKTRISEEEKAALLALIENVQREVRAAPPQTLAPVGPTYVSYDEHDQVVGIAYAEHHLGPEAGRVVAISADEAALLQPDNLLTDSEEPEMFKLYKRVDGAMHYHEAWWHEDKVMEHWGVCGTEGELREHAAESAAVAKKTMNRLKKDARAFGFRSIPPSRHITLVVEYKVDGFGDDSDLGRRHDLEGYLNERTGWLGLGYCDGGSSGSGTMEVFCVVVNFDLAKGALEKDLMGSPFAGFNRIYRME